MNDFSEKRDFQRMIVDSDLTFTIAGESEVCKGSVKDLSANGISFTTDKQIAEQSELIILLTPVSSITPPMEARVIVARVSGEGSELELACEITEILK